MSDWLSLSTKKMATCLDFFLAKFVITTPIYMTYIRYKLHTHTRKKMTSHWKSIWLAFTFYYIWKKCHVLTLFGFSFVVINADKWRCYFFVCVSHLFFFFIKRLIYLYNNDNRERMNVVIRSGFFFDYLSIRYKYLANFDSVISKQQVLFGFLISSSK